MLGVRDYSIRKKLTWMSMLTSGPALLLACGALLVFEWAAFRGEILARVSTQAQIIGSNSAAALLFDDPSAAQKTLAGLKAEPEILDAAIYTREGRLFAFYSRGNADITSSLPKVAGLQADQHWFEKGHLVLLRQIEEGGEPAGTVYIRSDLPSMARRLKRYGAIMILVLGASFLAALFISSRLQPLIVGPVLELAKTARSVSQEGNYSVRAKPGNRDEVGSLIETFNGMLEQIQERDNELQEARADLEQRVTERTAELETSNRELEAFTYSVSHDLRAPLRHLDGFSRLLMEDYAPQLDDSGKKYVQQISSASRAMGRLIDELLGLSRMGRREVQRQMTGLDTLVQETVAELEPAVDGRQVEWKISKLGFADCDPALMKQVFVNLLSNALKYTRPREQAVIEVGAENRNGQSAYFVRDNGVGFSMKYANKLFGVFQRLHRAEDFEGTGVGLATVQRIIHKHGGRIWAEAEVNQGAAFHFTLGAVETGATGRATHTEEVGNA